MLHKNIPLSLVIFKFNGFYFTNYYLNLSVPENMRDIKKQNIIKNMLHIQQYTHKKVIKNYISLDISQK